MLVISDGLGALRFESISFPFTHTLWNDARSTGRRECGKAIYHDHSPAHYRFHFWHIIKGNRFITDKFRIYFHSTTTGKRLVLTFVIFFFLKETKTELPTQVVEDGLRLDSSLGVLFVCLFFSLLFQCLFCGCERTQAVVHLSKDSLWKWLSPDTGSILRTELRSLVLVAGAFLLSAVLPAHVYSYGTQEQRVTRCNMCRETYLHTEIELTLIQSN